MRRRRSPRRSLAARAARWRRQSLERRRYSWRRIAARSRPPATAAVRRPSLIGVIKKQKCTSGSSSVTPELIIEDSAPAPPARLRHESFFIPSWGVKTCDSVLSNTITARELILKGVTPADQHVASSYANRAYQNMATSQLYNSETIKKMLALAEENDKLEVTLLEKDKDINMKDRVIAHNAEILSKNEIEISQLKATNNRLMAKVGRVTYNIFKTKVMSFKMMMRLNQSKKKRKLERVLDNVELLL
ncbi:hypothetical protein Scep_018786 [Stephania cephalantha]|uniref:Uncharacterized protein n=1 Tax=Stephania cephalantha TaxID=152367 RepID=A0AAP0I9V5_9MAGN